MSQETPLPPAPLLFNITLLHAFTYCILKVASQKQAESRNWQCKMICGGDWFGKLYILEGSIFWDIMRKNGGGGYMYPYFRCL
jgi:hypothetical protein